MLDVTFCGSCRPWSSAGNKSTKPSQFSTASLRRKRMQDQAVRLLTNLLGIYSPSGKEADIASFLAEEMKKLGFQVGIDAIGNVIGVVGEGGPVIQLWGPMATVSRHLQLRARA